MIKLEDEYTLRGRKEWKYKIIKREGDVCMVEVHRIDRLEDENSPLSKVSFQGYEVFVVQRYPERERPDKKGMIAAKELPPPDFHWGRLGHTFCGAGDQLKKAEERYEVELVQQVERLKKREEKSALSTPHQVALALGGEKMSDTEAQGTIDEYQALISEEAIIKINGVKVGRLKGAFVETEIIKPKAIKKKTN